MAKYGKKAQETVKETMKQFEKGELHSGKTERVVTNPKQAIAIALSEARKKGIEIPPYKKTTKE